MIDRLWVMWREEASETRFPVGQLWREDPKGFAFAYESLLPERFALLPEFSEHRTYDAPYRATYLFATFAERIPSPARPDFRELMRSWEVEHPDDQLEVLARSGGILMTDGLEVCEWRPASDRLRAPLVVRAAGTKHYPGGAVAEPGDAVRLVRNPANPHDPNAVQIHIEAKGVMLGHVPRPYADLVATLLDGGEKIGGEVVRKLGLPQSYGRWLVSLHQTA